MNQSLKYRTEIDGLRAVAVLSVLIYHINPNWLPGGFLGVDVFFVISGFLITFIIQSEINSNKFTFTNFYIRRIKRILPILYVVIVVTFIVGSILFTPKLYVELAKSSFSSVLFNANHRFALAGNYFQTDSVRPLLHLWSLSVEEQFYFIWPFIILSMSIMKIGIKNIFIIVLVLIFSSFTIAEYMTSNSALSRYSYFILPTRMAELLIGAGVALFYTNLKNIFYKSIYSIIGGLGLIFSFVFISKENNIPGVIMLIPCLSVALIILSKNTVVTKLLSLKPLVFIGIISYSLYLWHWPVITYIKHVNVNFTFTYFTATLLTLVLFFLSYISLRLIETPIRQSNMSNKKVFWILFILPSILILSISYFIIKSKGLPERFGVPKNVVTIETIGCHSSYFKTDCFLTNNITSENKILLIGDSHGGHFSDFFSKLGLNIDASIIDATAADCRFYSKKHSNFRCNIAKEKINKWKNKVKKIIIVKRFDNYFPYEDMFINEFLGFINSFTSNDIQVAVMAQVPTHDKKNILDHYLMTKNKLSIASPEIQTYRTANSKMKEFIDPISNAYFVELDPIFCPQNKCEYYDGFGVPLYYDDNHLNSHGSIWAAERILKSSEDVWLIRFLKE